MAERMFEFSIAGKVFLAGEYLALAGGPSLIAAIQPRFRLQVREVFNAAGSNPFHENSPSGLLWNKNREFLKSYELEFIDPSRGLGGFGGSTAEFALLHAFLDWKQLLCEEAQPVFDLRRIWQDYRQLAGNSTKSPSGADLIGQLNGQLTIFDRTSGKINQHAWLFQDIGFMLFRTPHKLKTHEHLKSLGEFPTARLEQTMQLVVQGLNEIRSEVFIEGIRNFIQELNRLGFVADSTRRVLEQIRSPGILAKKGCGAMGADVICLFVDQSKSQRQAVIEELQGFGCSFVADEMSLSPGLFADEIPFEGRSFIPGVSP